ncbi:hypothetical protein HF086_015000 [Spodoptera exigua]|uniref:E3 ubiquitin-protein ligase n=1 Tax=Spodoptera exigua TaxID=7107 RepID=A0A922SEN5_SPOEX|nr:hypothetical protein HF086_015000 [Spodoptera exigua]
MSSVHCVVVWEWQCSGQWLPHTPGVTRTLERAHAKKLTRVVLADADPALKGHYVNLRTLTQSVDTPEGGSVECRVRRSCYSVTSPAGRGLRWEWARFVTPPLGGELNYEPLPVEVQCLLEESWSGNGEQVSFDGWVASVSRMTARGGGAGAGGAGGVALLRRGPQPPYPLTRPAPPHPPPPPDRPLEGRRPRIPQQHTGSSVHSVQSVHSVHSLHSLQASQASQTSATMPRQGARSASPRDRKPGLARQILHNLNIFSHSKQTAESRPRAAADSRADGQGGRAGRRGGAAGGGRAASGERAADTDCSSTRSGRRHSVDTVSTYLSHESKDSLQQTSVGELLNCSGSSSDDVFEEGEASLAPAPAPPAPPDMPTSDGSIVGVDEASAAVCVWVRAEACPQWGALCPACMRSLEEGAAEGGAGPCVALTGCGHMVHLACLNRRLERLRAAGAPLYIDCLVCGRVYGRPAGAQPPGSMAWTLQAAALPQHPPCSSSILVTYNFQSGLQGPQHPVPGAPYYAVGFPRYTVLPDTPLGHQVVQALRAAWERGVLFTVCASQTTGREHVVAWRAPPPPAAPHHYAPPARPHHLLRDALARLRALLPSPAPMPASASLL